MVPCLVVDHTQVDLWLHCLESAGLSTYCLGRELHLGRKASSKERVYPKEFELFRYFMENAGEIVTREMLLRDVWKMDFDPQTNVVDVNIGRLRRKLEEGFETPALETIWGSGYRILDGR